MPNPINALRTRVVKTKYDLHGRHTGRFQAQGSTDGLNWFCLGECSEPEWAIKVAALAYIRATDTHPHPGEIVWTDAGAYEDLHDPHECP